LWEDAKRARDAAEVLRVTAPDLLRLGVIDGVIPEPPGGAHRSWERAAEAIREALRETLAELSGLARDELVQRRYAKFRRMGVFGAPLHPRDAAPPPAAPPSSPVAVSSPVPSPFAKRPPIAPRMASRLSGPPATAMTSFPYAADSSRSRPGGTASTRWVSGRSAFRSTMTPSRS